MAGIAIVLVLIGILIFILNGWNRQVKGRDRPDAWSGDEGSIRHGLDATIKEIYSAERRILVTLDANSTIDASEIILDCSEKTFPLDKFSVGGRVRFWFFKSGIEEDYIVIDAVDKL